MVSGEIDPRYHKFWLSVEFLKNLEATILFVDFAKAFDSIHRGKIEQILLAYSLPKETVATIMMLYRNMKVKVCSPDGDTDYFDIVAGVLQGDTLAPYLFIISQDYVLRTSIDWMKENCFQLTKERSRRYPAQTIMDAEYAYDIALLANTPTQAESLLHSLEWAAAGIGLHVNAHKMEHMCFNQRGDISTLNGSSLKLVDKFTYLINWDRHQHGQLSIGHRSYGSQTWPIKWNADFFHAVVVLILLYGCTTWTLTKRKEKKAWWQLHKNAASNIEQVLEEVPHKTAAVRPLTSHHKNYKPDMRDTAGEVGTIS